MRVDGRDITVSGSLLQPLTRRTNDILRLVFAAVFLAAVITSSLITRNEWVALEKSISEIVGVLTPTQSNLVYLVYGIAILALPFAILIGLIVARQWKLLGAYAAAAFIAVHCAVDHRQRHRRAADGISTCPSGSTRCCRSSSTTRGGSRCSPPCSPCPARGCPRVGGGGGGRCCSRSCRSTSSSARWCPPARCWAWRSVGSSARWSCSWSARLRSRCRSTAPCGPWPGADSRWRRLTVVRPAGPGPLVLSARSTRARIRRPIVEMYGPNQRSGGFLRQFWRWLRLRNSETAPLQASMRRAVEHRALMAIAIGDLGVANTSTAGRGRARPRMDVVRAHSPVRHRHRRTAPTRARVARVWESLGTLHDHQISHGDLRSKEITIDDGTRAVRRVRQRRIRRHRRTAAGRHRPAAGDDELTCTAPSPRSRAAVDVFGKDAVLDGVATTDQVRYAIPNPQVGDRRRRASCPPPATR